MTVYALSGSAGKTRYILGAEQSTCQPKQTKLSVPTTFPADPLSSHLSKRRAC